MLHMAFDPLPLLQGRAYPVRIELVCWVDKRKIKVIKRNMLPTLTLCECCKLFFFKSFLKIEKHHVKVLAVGYKPPVVTEGQTWFHSNSGNKARSIYSMLSHLTLTPLDGL